MSGTTAFALIIGSIIIYSIVSRICECLENITKEKEKEKKDE